MSTKQTSAAQNGARWLRVGVMAFTTVAPVVNMLIERMRQAELRQQEQQLESEQEVEAEQDNAPRNLVELTSLSRQLAVAQAQQLRKQARQWQAQATQLRKALRKESKQRRRLNKMVKHLQAAGVDWSQEMLKRSEGLTGDLVAQGSKISQDFLERGSSMTQDWTERGSELSSDLMKRGGDLSQDWLKRGSKASRNLTKRGRKLTHDLTERGGELSQDLLKRGSDVTHDLMERGETLLQPARRRKSTFWTVFGFSVGMVAAAVITYLFVRKRLAQQLSGEEQQIELPPRESAWNGNGIGTMKPSGEIHHIDSNGATVATLQSVGTQQEAPADAAFVGVISTKTYYPIEVSVTAKDLIYFASEEEAQADGFTAAVTK